MGGKIIQQVAKKGINLYNKWKQKGQPNKQQTSQKEAVKKEKTAEEKTKALDEKVKQQAKEATKNLDKDFKNMKGVVPKSDSQNNTERTRNIIEDHPVYDPKLPSPSKGMSNSKSKGREL